MSVSELRVNRITHTAGVGTITTNADGMVVTGIVTANSFSGDGGGLTGVSGLGTALGTGLLSNVFYFDKTLTFTSKYNCKSTSKCFHCLYSFCRGRISGWS